MHKIRAMQLWFARVNGVSLREQLVTQTILGILCHDLRPGERLPSTRELARRFHLHPNTVSAGYRQLHREHWVEFRRGSGVYVSESKPDVPPSSSIALDRLVLNLFREARKLGTSMSGIRERLGHWLDLQPPDHFLLIEPREGLREIVALEMRQKLTLPVESCAANPAELRRLLDSAIPVTLAGNANTVRKLLPASVEPILLGIRSVPSSLVPWLPYSSDVLVGVASGWPEFLKLARTVLVAAGFHKDDLVFRDTRRSNWRRGLEQTAAVVCDSATAALLPKSCRSIVFPVLSDSSLRDLQEYQEFVRNPLSSSM